MKTTRFSRFATALTLTLLVTALLASGSVSCGRWSYKSSIVVGTTDVQQAFYASLIAVNAYHYPFASVNASTGTIVTGQMDLGGGNWYSFNIQVLPTGEVQIDPVTNMEKPHNGGVVIPRGVLNRANNIGRYIRKVVVERTPDQIVAQGELIHQSVLGGLASVQAGSAGTVPVVGPATSTGEASPAPVPPSGG